MTNEEKFNTPEERNEAFHRFCANVNDCSICPLGKTPGLRCPFAWLTLEAEEKPLLCPFCGGDAEVVVTNPISISKGAYVRCKECRVLSMPCDTKDEAIATWNRRVK